ncbi:transketolase, partial [Lacrimispora sp.]
KAEFKNFRQLHSILQGHPDAKKVPGIDASTGSLGQGISIAVGMALGAKAQNKDTKVYTMLGDGELQEGQVWEACMAAANYHLDNLTIIIDNNGLQIDGSNEQVMSLGDLSSKFKAFGFNVLELPDGNNLEEVLAAYSISTMEGKPKCILAHTVKGKGVSFMENQVGWHGKAPSEAERQQALKELEG